MTLRRWLGRQTRWLFYSIAYLDRPPWDTGITPPEVISFVQNHPAGRALELGCGTGTNTCYLAHHGWEVVGVDLAAKAIQTGRRKAAQAGLNVRFAIADASRPLPVNGLFDLVLDIGCLHSVPKDDRGGYYANLAHLLAEQGRYLVYGFIADPDRSSQPGLQPVDFSILSGMLALENLVEGVDPNGRRSVWAQYRKA